jgi:hypothetical protein
MLTICHRYKFWGAEIAANPPEVAYDDVMNPDSEEGIAKLTRLIVSTPGTSIGGLNTHALQPSR